MDEQNKIKTFWGWFLRNNENFLLINKVTEDEKGQLLEEFKTKLHEYCDHLYFEIGGDNTGPFELIITAEGNIDYFSQVEDLITSAPPIKNWKFIAFKPAMGTDFVTNFEGVVLEAEKIWFLLYVNETNPAKPDIALFFENYTSIKESKWFNAAVFKLLDTVLGEKSAALDIGNIEVAELPDNPNENR